MGAQKRSLFFSPGAVIDRYFLEEKNPYSKRRPIKMKSLFWSGGIVLGLFIFGVIFLGGAQERQNLQKTDRPDFKTSQNLSVVSTNQGLALRQSYADNSNSDGNWGKSLFGPSLGLGGQGDLRTSQTRSANQVIRRGASGNDPSAALPMGYGIKVKLLNAVLSSNTSTPVIAEVMDDVYIHGVLSIPAGTHAIGSTQYDESSRRIQVRFQNFVYPDGDQHDVQALGMMSDGSAGLGGDYHSGETKRQTGRFLGHFIAGMADGMKERRGGGSFGMAYEPGSIKNGALNGITLSAQDQAKAFTEDLNNTKPYMTLAAGQTFILFLEREYVP